MSKIPSPDKGWNQALQLLWRWKNVVSMTAEEEPSAEEGVQGPFHRNLFSSTPAKIHDRQVQIQVLT